MKPLPNITKVARLVKALRECNRPMDAQDVSAVAEINLSTVYGWMYALQEEGLVVDMLEHPRRWRWKQ